MQALPEMFAEGAITPGGLCVDVLLSPLAVTISKALNPCGQEDTGKFSVGNTCAAGGSNGSENSNQSTRREAKPASQAGTGSVQDGRRVARGNGELESSGDAAAAKNTVSSEPLTGSPTKATIPGVGEVSIGPFMTARQAAADYAKEAGLPYHAPTEYAKVDKERATKIAKAYDEMEHNPTDPVVKAAYDSLARETLAQWEAIKATGLKVEIIDFAKQGDPYAKSPRLAIEDIKNNNHFWVFPSSAGFGSSEEFDASDNPLLAMTDERISGQRVCVNDIFRIVHDYFGHAKEGNGMRADGEENAWRSHSAMFSPLARWAMTTETRGQNSWVNFGQHAEHNRTASGGATHYADQKIGLLPWWVVEEGAGSPVKPPVELLQRVKKQLNECGQNKDGTFSQDNTCAAGDGNPIEMGWTPEFASNLKEDLDYAKTPEEVKAILEHYRAEPVHIGGDERADLFMRRGEVIELYSDGLFLSLYDDIGEFVSQANLDDYFPNAEQQFNDAFWDGSPGVVYHATPEENVESIMRDGIGAASETRGMSNRHVGSAVYTSTNPEAIVDSYGPSLIEIDLAAMKRDGYMPFVTQEPDIAEYDLRMALAHALGDEGNFQWDVESGMDPETVVFDRGIPAKYLKVVDAL